MSPFQLRLARGIESWLWELAPAIADTGTQVDVVAWSGPIDRRFAVGPECGLVFRAVPKVRWYEPLWAVPWYVALLVERPPDMAFISFAGYGEGLALWLAPRTPVSIVFHFPPSLVPHRFEEFRRWGLDRRAKHLIAVSPHVAREVEAWCGRPCHVIGHGVNCDRFRPDAVARREVRQALGIPMDVPVIVTAAALEERKGIQHVISALPVLRQQRSDARYIVLGDGAYRERLVDLVRSLGLSDCVHLVGAVQDVERYYAASDMGVLLSTGEALGLVVLEYAAAGLPVVALDCEPFVSFVDPTWSRLVADTRDRAVADALHGLLEAPAHAAMSERARAWAERQTWHDVAQCYLGLLGESAVDGRLSEPGGRSAQEQPH